MSKIITFVRESYKELTQNVFWPSYRSLRSSTTLVLLASFIFALVVGGMDILFETILKFVYEEF